MADGTDARTASEEATAPSTDWCHWHAGPSTTALVVRAVERPSGGAPYPLYACAPCRETYELTPLADQTGSPS